jgi:hypothetical protein
MAAGKWAENLREMDELFRTTVENLPINRRSYLDFALLAPGVVETNDLVDDNDYRVAQAPQSGISFGGGNGRGNAFTIDGLVNYYNSGGVRPSNDEMGGPPPGFEEGGDSGAGGAGGGAGGGGGGHSGPGGDDIPF